MCCFVQKGEKDDLRSVNLSRARAVSAVANISFPRANPGTPVKRDKLYKRNGSLTLVTSSPATSVSKGNLMDMSGLQKSVSSLSTTSDSGNPAQESKENCCTTRSANSTVKSSRKQQYLVPSHQFTVPAEGKLEKISKKVDDPNKTVQFKSCDDIFAACKQPKGTLEVNNITDNIDDDNEREGTIRL